MLTWEYESEIRVAEWSGGPVARDAAGHEGLLRDGRGSDYTNQGEERSKSGGSHVSMKSWRY